MTMNLDLLISKFQDFFFMIKSGTDSLGFLSSVVLLKGVSLFVKIWLLKNAQPFPLPLKIFKKKIVKNCN